MFNCCRYLSTLYSHPTWPEKSVKEIADTELKASMVSNSWGRSKPGFFGQLLYHFLAGKSYDANSTVTDAFGKMLGDILLRGVSVCTGQIFLCCTVLLLIALPPW